MFFIGQLSESFRLIEIFFIFRTPFKTLLYTREYYKCRVPIIIVASRAASTILEVAGAMRLSVESVVVISISIDASLMLMMGSRRSLGVLFGGRVWLTSARRSTIGRGRVANCSSSAGVAAEEICGRLSLPGVLRTALMLTRPAGRSLIVSTVHSIVLLVVTTTAAAVFSSTWFIVIGLAGVLVFVTL